MITKRVLMTWRREALQEQAALDQYIDLSTNKSLLTNAKLANSRILTLTQELIDQHLLTETIKGETK